MRIRTLLSALAPLALASGAVAGEGWYFGLEGGNNWIDDTSVVRVINAGPPFATEFGFDSGWAAFLTIGHKFSSRWRLELEGGYRRNDFELGPNELSEWSAMANALYDIPLTERVGLSIGVGAGADYATLKLPAVLFDESSWNFAYQGIAGFSYVVSPRVDVFANYRYFQVVEPEFSGVANFDGLVNAHYALDDLVKHTVTVGFRYHFGAPAQTPMPAVSTPPSTPTDMPREFIVFFGHNKANLSAQAQDVVRQAADAAKRDGSATIRVVGHADRSGSAAYNQRLSVRRANSVKDALVGQGIAGGAITTSAKGENEPLVQTDDGVREPQNRRVHINL